MKNDLWHRFHVKQMLVFVPMICSYTLNSIDTIYQAHETVEVTNANAENAIISGNNFHSVYDGVWCARFFSSLLSCVVLTSWEKSPLDSFISLLAP